MWTPPTRRLPTRHIDANILTENTVDIGEHSGLWTILQVDAFASLALGAEIPHFHAFGVNDATPPDTAKLSKHR